MCRAVCTFLAILAGAYMLTQPQPPAHLSWKGTTVHKGGNASLAWSLQQTHVDRVPRGAVVWFQLRAKCEGEGTVHWPTHSVRVQCPFDVNTIAVHPVDVVFETEVPQRVHAHAEILALHTVPRLEHWSPL